MIHPSSVHTVLYGTGVVLALLVWTIAAGLVSKYDGDCELLIRLHTTNSQSSTAATLTLPTLSSLGVSSRGCTTLPREY